MVWAPTPAIDQSDFLVALVTWARTLFRAPEQLDQAFPVLSHNSTILNAHRPWASEPAVRQLEDESSLLEA